MLAKKNLKKKTLSLMGVDDKNEEKWVAHYEERNAFSMFNDLNNST